VLLPVGGIRTRARGQRRSEPAALISAYLVCVLSTPENDASGCWEEHLGAFAWPGGGSYVPEVRGFGGARGIPPVGFVAWGIVGFCSGLALGRSAPRPDERAFPVLQPLLLAALCIKGLALGLGSAVPWALAFGAAALLFHPATAAALARLRPASHPPAAG